MSGPHELTIRVHVSGNPVYENPEKVAAELLDAAVENAECYADEGARQVELIDAEWTP